jgi:hypothetical protein
MKEETLEIYLRALLWYTKIDEHSRKNTNYSIQVDG